MRKREPNVKDYEKEHSEFEWNVPEDFNFGFDVVDKWAEDRTKLALYTVEDDWKDYSAHSYWDLKVQSNRVANMVKELGIKKGDRVLVMLPRIPEFYFAMLGLIKAGVIGIPTPTLSVAKDLEYRMNQAKAVAVITGNEYTDRVDSVHDKIPSLEHKIVVGKEKNGWLSYEEKTGDASPKYSRNDREPTSKDDPMLIFFTSGTTSYPKMVLHTQNYGFAHQITAYMTQDLKSTDLIWVVADTGWAKTAWGKFFGQFYYGACVLQFNQKGRFDPSVVLGILEKYGITVFCAPPTIYRMLILGDHLSKADLSYLRHALSAGEPLNPEVIEAWEKETGLKIYDYYGQTESVALLGNAPCKPIKIGSMGFPTIGHDVEIIDDEGNVLPVGEEGHIAVKITPEKPPGLLKEYWKNPGANEEAFRGEWYYTGDKAYKDVDGYFWFVGRADDVIKASGYRIGPFEVESALQEHVAVAESAVIGVPDDVRGNIVKAYIILAPGHEGNDALVKELQDHVKKVTAPYKYPREIDFVEELPKTLSGKIKRKDLRKEEMEKRKQG